MKTFLIVIAMFFIASISNATTNNNNYAYTETVTAYNNTPEYVDSVEAQDMHGTKTRYFSIWGQRLSNGKYNYYAKDDNGTYSIHYANNNRYKPFYVKIGNERWYFMSKVLDRNSGKTDQW